ncbi:hypothetical protein T484DRAFT_3635071, partial [Baffinella frigidus]
MGKNGTPSMGSAGKRKKGGEGAEKGSAPLPKVGSKASSGDSKTMRPQKDGSGAKPPLKKKRELTAAIEGNGGGLGDGEGTAARKAEDFFQRTSEEIAEQWYPGAHAHWGARSSGDDVAGFHAYCEIHPITLDPEGKKSAKEWTLAQKKKWKKLTTPQQDKYILRAYLDNHPRAVPPLFLRDPQDEEPSSLPSSKKPNKRQKKNKGKERKADGARPDLKKREGETSVVQDKETVPDFWPSDSRILDVLSREEVLPADGPGWINANLSCTDSREVASKWLLPADQDWREATKRASLFKASNKEPPTSGRGLRIHQVGARIALQSPTHYHVALKGIVALFEPWILKEGEDALGDVEFKEAGIEEQIEDLLARRDVRLECMAREARTKSKMGIPSSGRKLLRSRVALLGQKLAEARIRQSGPNPRTAREYESSLEKDVREIQQYEDFESFLKGLKAKRKHSASSSGSEEDSSSGEDRNSGAEELSDKQDEPSGGETSPSSCAHETRPRRGKKARAAQAPAPRLLSWRAHTAASTFHKDGVPLGILHPEIDNLAPEDGRYKCLTTGRPISKEAFFKRQRRAEKEREALSDSRKRAEGMEKARAAHELATEERDSRRRLRDEEEERRAERHSAKDLISKENRRAALRLDCYARAVEAAGKSGTKAEKLDFYTKVLEGDGGDLLDFSAPGTGRYTEKLELLVGIVLSATTAVTVANSRARELGKERASLETALGDALDTGNQGEDNEEEALAFMKGLQESLEQVTKDASEARGQAFAAYHHLGGARKVLAAKVEALTLEDAVLQDQVNQRNQRARAADRKRGRRTSPFFPEWILEQRNRAMSSGPREGGPPSEDLGESTTDDERAESTHSGEEEVCTGDEESEEDSRSSKDTCGDTQRRRAPTEDSEPRVGRRDHVHVDAEVGNRHEQPDPHGSRYSFRQERGPQELTAREEQRRELEYGRRHSLTGDGERGTNRKRDRETAFALLATPEELRARVSSEGRRVHSESPPGFLSTSVWETPKPSSAKEPGTGNEPLRAWEPDTHIAGRDPEESLAPRVSPLRESMLFETAGHLQGAAHPVDAALQRVAETGPAGIGGNRPTIKPIFTPEIMKSVLLELDGHAIECAGSATDLERSTAAKRHFDRITPLIQQRLDPSFSTMLRVCGKVGAITAMFPSRVPSRLHDTIEGERIVDDPDSLRFKEASVLWLECRLKGMDSTELNDVGRSVAESSQLDAGIPELQPTHMHFEKVYRQYVQDVTLKYGILTGWLTMFTAIEERATSNVNSKWKSGPGSNIISAIMSSRKLGFGAGVHIHPFYGLWILSDWYAISKPNHARHVTALRKALQNSISFGPRCEFAAQLFLDTMTRDLDHFHAAVLGSSGGSSGQIIHEDRGLISDFIDRYKQLLADPSNHLLPAAHIAHAERLLYLNTRNDAGVYTVTELIKQMWTWDQETFTPPAAPYTDLQSGRGLDPSDRGAAQRRRKATVQKVTANYDEDFDAGYEDEDYGATTGPAEGESVAWATLGYTKYVQALRANRTHSDPEVPKRECAKNCGVMYFQGHQTTCKYRKARLPILGDKGALPTCAYCEAPFKGDHNATCAKAQEAMADAQPGGGALHFPLGVSNPEVFMIVMGHLKALWTNDEKEYGWALCDPARDEAPARRRPARDRMTTLRKHHVRAQLLYATLFPDLFRQSPSRTIRNFDEETGEPHPDSRDSMLLRQGIPKRWSMEVDWALDRDFTSAYVRLDMMDSVVRDWVTRSSLQDGGLSGPIILDMSRNALSSLDRRGNRRGQSSGARARSGGVAGSDAHPGERDDPEEDVEAGAPYPRITEQGPRPRYLSMQWGENRDEQEAQDLAAKEMGLKNGVPMAAYTTTRREPGVTPPWAAPRRNFDNLHEDTTPQDVHPFYGAGVIIETLMINPNEDPGVTQHWEREALCWHTVLRARDVLARETCGFPAEDQRVLWVKGTRPLHPFGILPVNPEHIRCLVTFIRINFGNSIGRIEMAVDRELENMFQSLDLYRRRERQYVRDGRVRSDLQMGPLFTGRRRRDGGPGSAIKVMHEELAKVRALIAGVDIDEYSNTHQSTRQAEPLENIFVTGDYRQDYFIDIPPLQLTQFHLAEAAILFARRAANVRWAGMFGIQQHFPGTLGVPRNPRWTEAALGRRDLASEAERLSQFVGDVYDLHMDQREAEEEHLRSPLEAECFYPELRAKEMRDHYDIQYTTSRMT